MGIIVDGKTYISRNQYFDHLAEENKKLKSLVKESLKVIEFLRDEDMTTLHDEWADYFVDKTDEVLNE